MHRPRRYAALAAAAALAIPLAGCSGSSDDADPTRPAASGSASPAAAPAQPLAATVGVVAGALPPADRQAAAAAVGEVVDGYLDAAYVGGDWPRTDFGAAFAGFTKGAATEAKGRAGLLTNQRVGGQVSAVTVDRKSAKVDLVAAERKAVGATARFRLLFTTEGDYARQVRVVGRLLLTPVGGGWKVFGYDVRKVEL